MNAPALGTPVTLTDGYHAGFLLDDDNDKSYYAFEVAGSAVIPRRSCVRDEKKKLAKKLYHMKKIAVQHVKTTSGQRCMLFFEKTGGGGAS
ncbi:hypothetical protein A3C18_02385 [Candidatus Kaiserbacteria bacterium RIFCSPHIGHO2_02_FULL_54_11b]|uniref:Uncharacterized protein n=1 Tax=Candidatus Kaiserbacteria bacterium RIFCSPHIGHO2_02_FULL_54_11b TaxID=1798494 RepID=A0A1F6DRZ6_9BACT|nr:MAG: hypothetical protein A3C18_02385 [Candidatus Kaiserbacteria bacterium RIFCSPHIGHO2_02_FULL_54_11b]